MREIKLTIKCANLSTKASRCHFEEYESYLLKLYHWSKFKLRQISRCHVCSCITRINWVLNRIPVEVVHRYLLYKEKKKNGNPHPHPKKPIPHKQTEIQLKIMYESKMCHYPTVYDTVVELAALYIIEHW